MVTKRLFGTSAITLFFTASASPAHAAPWVRTYVVEWVEAANYYGAKSGTIEPGTDCPAGAAAAPDWVAVMMAAGYTEKEANWLRDPANPTRSPINGQPLMGFRGAKHQNVYDYPTTTPEVGLPPVTGTIGEGFNLDGDTKTGFISPTGEKGIDNGFYKALGCWKSVRGPARLADAAKGANDSMREGAWTVLIVVSGDGKDPLNDPKVQIGLYASDDKIVRDGAGGVAKDYTFAIRPDRKLQALFQGSSRNGVITARAADTIWMSGPDTRELQLAKARLQLAMKPDGALSGQIGGYRPWRPIYENLVNGRGPVVEALTWVRLPDIYYALQRYADYSPTGPGGEKTFISYHMRIDATPAYVVTPDTSGTVKQVQLFTPSTAGGTKVGKVEQPLPNGRGG